MRDNIWDILKNEYTDLNRRIAEIEAENVSLRSALQSLLLAVDGDEYHCGMADCLDACYEMKDSWEEAIFKANKALKGEEE